MLFKRLVWLTWVAAVLARWEVITKDNKPKEMTFLKFADKTPYVDGLGTLNMKPSADQDFKFKIQTKCIGIVSLEFDGSGVRTVSKIEKAVQFSVNMEGKMTFDDTGREPEQYKKPIVLDESGTVKVDFALAGNCQLFLMEGDPMFDNPNSTVEGKPGLSEANLGAIIGGVLGGLVVLGVVAVLLYYCCYKKKKDKQQKEEEEEKAAEKAAEKALKKKGEQVSKVKEDKDSNAKDTEPKALPSSNSSKKNPEKEKEKKEAVVDKPSEGQQFNAGAAAIEAKIRAERKERQIAADAARAEAKRLKAAKLESQEAKTAEQKPVEEKNKSAVKSTKEKIVELVKASKEKIKSLVAQATQTETKEAAPPEPPKPPEAPRVSIPKAVFPPDNVATTYYTLMPTFGNHRLDFYLKGGMYVTSVVFGKTTFYTHFANPVVLNSLDKNYLLSETISKAARRIEDFAKENHKAYKYLLEGPNAPVMMASHWNDMRIKHYATFKRVGPPDCRDDVTLDYIVMDSIHNYLFNIGVFDVHKRNAAGYLDLCYQANITQLEFDFFSSSLEQVGENFTRVCVAGMLKFNKTNFLIGRPSAEVYAYMDTEKWGFFDRLIYFYHHHKQLFDGFSILPAHCSRLPLQGLLVLAVREHLVKGEALMLLLKWFHMAAFGILRQNNLWAFRDRIHYPVLSMMFMWVTHDFSHVKPETLSNLRRFLMDDLPVPMDWVCME